MSDCPYKYEIEFLDFNGQYHIKTVRSWYGDMGAVNRLQEIDKIISINGEIHDDFSFHKRLCPVCNPEVRKYYERKYPNSNPQQNKEQ